MKIGYPCINNWIGCTSSQTFRLKSYSEDLLKEKIYANLVCLQKTLEYNVTHGLLFFRIASGIVPFASHPINTFDWQAHFRAKFEAIGEYIRKNNFRISVHPDQFTLINSISEEIFARSRNELQYHADLLDCLNLDYTAKIQIHVGGAYGDKTSSMNTFVNRYALLDGRIKRRLVIENDERLYTADDCLAISRQTGIPVLFDVFHHKINHKPESSADYFALAQATWNPQRDGLLMVDYSSQKPNGKVGQHAESIDEEDFRSLLLDTKQFDFDIMLEIKDKEVSALKAQKIFELGKVTLPDALAETRTRDENWLAAATTHPNAGFSEIKSALDSFMANFGVEWQIRETTHPSFMEGRVGEIMVGGVCVGIIGEVNPSVLEAWKLENPAAAFQLQLQTLINAKLAKQ